MELVRRESVYNCTKSTSNGQRVVDFAAAARGFDSEMYGFTSLGQLIAKVRPVDKGCSGSERWECYDQLQPIIDLATVHCGIAANLWQLTRDALTGSFSCPTDPGE
jgi:hypothetical protein